MKNKLICPHCNEELKELRKIIRGTCHYIEYGRFDLENLTYGMEGEYDVDELTDHMQNNLYEIDTEDTDYDDWQSDEEFIECRHCYEEISLYDIAKQIIESKKEPRDMNIDFYVKNADNIH